MKLLHWIQEMTSKNPVGIFQALSFLLLSIWHSWAFDYLFQNFSSFSLCDTYALYLYLSFPISHCQFPLLVPPFLLDYYSLFSKPSTSFLQALPHASCDLMNSQISDTIYVRIVGKILSPARSPSGTLSSSIQIFTSYQYKCCDSH